MLEMGTNYHRTQGRMSTEAPIGINQNYFILPFLLFFLKKDCEIASNGMINPIGQLTSDEIYPMNENLFHREFSTNLVQKMEFHDTKWIQLRPEYKEEPINCLEDSFDATNFEGWHIKWF